MSAATRGSVVQRSEQKSASPATNLDAEIRKAECFVQSVEIEMRGLIPSVGKIRRELDYLFMAARSGAGPSHAGYANASADLAFLLDRLKAIREDAQSAQKYAAAPRETVATPVVETVEATLTCSHCGRDFEALHSQIDGVNESLERAIALNQRALSEAEGAAVPLDLNRNGEIEVFESLSMALREALFRLGAVRIEASATWAKRQRNGGPPESA